MAKSPSTPYPYTRKAIKPEINLADDHVNNPPNDDDILSESYTNNNGNPLVTADIAQRWLQSTQFQLSAPTFRLCPADTGLEVAFAGRSNAGKSSCINAITTQRQLARSSKTPGRTQMINFFHMGNLDKRLGDLPGYGYAAVPEAMKKEWQTELEKYLISRQSLAGLVLLMDIRHPLKFFDTQMLHWAKDGGLPVHVLLTKSDKFKYGASQEALQTVKKELKKLDLPFSIQLFSVLQKIGFDDMRLKLAEWLEYDPNAKPVEYDENGEMIVPTLEQVMAEVDMSENVLGEISPEIAEEIRLKGIIHHPNDD